GREEALGGGRQPGPRRRAEECMQRLLFRELSAVQRLEQERQSRVRRGVDLEKHALRIGQRGASLLAERGVEVEGEMHRAEEVRAPTVALDPPEQRCAVPRGCRGGRTRRGERRRQQGDSRRKPWGARREFPPLKPPKGRSPGPSPFPCRIPQAPGARREEGGADTADVQGQVRGGIRPPPLLGRFSRPDAWSGSLL